MTDVVDTPVVEETVAAPEAEPVDTLADDLDVCVTRVCVCLCVCWGEEKKRWLLCAT